MKAPVTLLCLAALPITAGEIAGTCAEPFSVAAKPGERLTMHLRSGEIHILGAEQPRILVTCGFSGDDPSRARIVFRASGDRPELEVGGGPSSQFHITVEVPRQSHLLLRVPAGEINVSGITGSKDVELRAGELVINVGDPAGYAHADASVLMGEIDASAFGADKGGMFRSWSTGNPRGKYRLHAHVTTGEIRLIR